MCRVAASCSYIRIHRRNEMAGLLKKTTGLTGLAVLPNPHKNLTVVYDKILRTLKKMPADASYRRHTEVIIQERLGHVKAVSITMNHSLYSD
ncbi:NADH dehydrogenase [ubiquinone] 1 alpha subcomplex subunit 5 [Lamellibrachia satsuma]|nr:NADH dehydrogenase [ubiquinone] 1 alpha subcomplex subunit 5 [Lamellibrachia satsuma]